MSLNIRRRLLIKGIVSTCLLFVCRIGFAAAIKVVAIRIWPSSTYTRITLESDQPIDYKQSVLANPDRLVIDINNLYLDNRLKTMNKLVNINDAYIKQIRVGQFEPHTVRIVVEVKQKVRPSLFKLKPIDKYANRFVIDLYPFAEAKDEASLLALLETFNEGTLQEKQSEITISSKKKEFLTVVIDPGHGGEDSGAIGFYKTREKTVVLQIAQRLRKLLQHEPGIKVYMTRSEDIFIPLSVRVAKARSQKADLFISIHADAFTKRSARGSSVYMLSTSSASSGIAKYLAQTQNRADEIGGVSRRGDQYVDYTLLDLIQTSTLTNSELLGQEVLKNIASINRLHKNNVEKAGFAVLKAPDIPSILVETAFISNLEEESKLRTTHFQNQMANAIFRGIKRYQVLRKH